MKLTNEFPEVNVWAMRWYLSNQTIKRNNVQTKTIVHTMGAFNKGQMADGLTKGMDNREIFISKRKITFFERKTPRFK
jgi:hypothetical protein